MLGQVALPLCFLFIIIALRKDIEESQGISNALWIPFIWTAISASKNISYWIDPKLQVNFNPEFNYISGSSRDRLFFLVLICLGVIVLFKRKNKIRVPFTENVWIYLLVFYSLLSISWSDYQSVSAKRWVRFAGDFIMVLIILSEDDPTEAIERIFRRCIILLIPLSIVFIKYYRYIGVKYNYSGDYEMWVGVTTDKNNLGILCAFGSIFLIWRILNVLPKIDFFDMFLLFLSLYLLAGSRSSRSSTSIVVFIIGLFLMLGIFFLKYDVTKIKKLLFSSVLLFIILQVILINFLNYSALSVFFSMTGRESTLTGRVPLWQELIKIGSQRPILGTGYGGFWIGSLTHNLWDTFGWKPTQGHNGYLDIFLELGIVGLFIVLLIIINTYNKIILSFAKNDKMAQLRIVFFFMILLHNLSESSIVHPTNYLWITFLFSAVYSYMSPAYKNVDLSNG